MPDNDTISRTCSVCGISISLRGNRAVRCVECQRKDINTRRRILRWEDRATSRTCLDCNMDISMRRHNAKRCAECQYEYKKARSRVWHNNPVNRKRINAYQRSWLRERIDDPAYRKKKNAWYRHWKRERYANDPEFRAKINEYNRLRKPWDSTVNAESVSALFEAQDGKCVCCNQSIVEGYELDHILPVSRGGASMLENLQLLSPGCNSRKHNNLSYFPPNGGQGLLALGV